MPRLIAPWFLLAALAAAPCSAGFLTGNKLFEMCTYKPDGTLYAAQCVGYIQGVADGMENPTASVRACIPNNVIAGQLEDIVVTYLRDHAAVRHYPAVSLVATALTQAFPCK